MPKAKATYVDGYVLLVPKNKVAAYKKMAREAAKMWMKHGALDYKECMIEDANPSFGAQILIFPKLTKAKPNETIWFSYVTYKSKAHRNQVNKKIYADMEKYQKEHPDQAKDMPFDLKKMAYGGFKVEVTG